MKQHTYYIILVGLLFTQCAPENTTWAGKSYHNLTSHYNSYYYAREEVRNIEQTIETSHKDNYNNILHLFPSIDSALATTYEKEVEEAIKMASLAIQRHPYSKWTDDAYILVGKARLYSLDWANAIQTFKYVNTKSEDKHARHKAIINLIKTFSVHQEYNNAQAAIDYLLKAKLNKENQKNFYLEKAYYHQLRGDYDNMVRSLTKASPLLKRSDRRGRIFFIIGQVYQQLGFEAEAFNFYKKCLATNPEYETDFYARLYMAQVTQISRNRDIHAARKSFKKLLRDRKNREFKDKIYFEMASFELKQGNIEPAIAQYNQAIREGNNKQIDGEAYLKLGEIHYEKLRNYEISQAYYDSAIQSLPQDFENYENIKARQQILNEFVKHLKTIAWQDSLLSLSALDSSALKAIVDSTLATRKKAEELANKGKKKRKKDNRSTIAQNSGNFFDGGGISGTDWYFGNPSAVALGQDEFSRIWGDIPLVDNWRRSQQIAGVRQQATSEIDTTNQTNQTSIGNPTEAEDAATVEYTKLASQIPRTPEEKEAALKKIEEAYFKLGDIYYFDLDEKDNAVTSFKNLLKRFPESAYEPEVLYKLYLIYKESQPSEAEKYAKLLNSKFPESTFTKILNNPNYLVESSKTIQQQKERYSEAYQKYTEGNYIESSKILHEALALGRTSFTSNLELLQILILGKSGDRESYKRKLEGFIQEYPQSTQLDFVKKLLKAVADMGDGSFGFRRTHYSTEIEGSHYFVVHYDKEAGMHEKIAATLEIFNRQYFRKQNLTTSSLVLDEIHAVTMVDKFPTKTIAMEYFNLFQKNKEAMSGITNLRFTTFIITNENFNKLYQTKGIDEYVAFFDKTYLKKTP